MDRHGTNVWNSSTFTFWLIIYDSLKCIYFGLYQIRALSTAYSFGYFIKYTQQNSRLVYTYSHERTFILLKQLSQIIRNILKQWMFYL